MCIYAYGPLNSVRTVRQSMTLLRNNERASHDWLAMPFIAIGAVVMLLFGTFQRGEGFAHVVSIIAAGYPIVAERSLRYGPTSHVVYCYVAWLVLTPLFFVIAFYSATFRRSIESDGYPLYRVVGLITVTMAFILFFPPDPSGTRTSTRWERLLASMSCLSPTASPASWRSRWLPSEAS